ncbi:MAG: PepSY-like domain-containing protein [Bacteroidetes bacterium]|nr:PepSY-like domain-containing protein [Bacteroidota bacterium]
MKKIILTAAATACLCGSLTITCRAWGGRELPGSIKTAFFAKYPGARLKKWDVENDRYVVNFVSNKDKLTAVYSMKGSWLMTEKKVPWMKDLPPAVRTAFNKGLYADWKVESIRECQGRDGDRLYKLQVDNGDMLDSDHYDAFKTTKVLTYTSDGRVL